GRQAVSDLGVPILDDATLYDTLVDPPPGGAGAYPPGDAGAPPPGGAGAPPPAPALKPTAAYGGPVITIGSASKSFWGGLRVGWLRADPATVGTPTPGKRGEEPGTSGLAH